MVFETAFIATACVLLAVGTPAAAQSRPDEQAIQRLASQFERAWNTHDMTPSATWSRTMLISST